ncbi:MAG: hypothetical protein SFZ23_03265 [Planctomycetota bacterium]|nr:hypothetical protein [Planctomycetota bacterium]
MSDNALTTTPKGPTNSGEVQAQSAVLLDLRAGSAGEGGVVRPKQLSSQNVILAVVVVVSAGMLYGMRALGMSSQPAGDDFRIEYEPVAVDPVKRFAQERALQGLQRSQTAMELEPGKLSLSPFLTKAKDEVPEEDPLKAAELIEAQRRAEKEKRDREAAEKARDDAASKLVLHSVMGGRVPVARINDSIYRVNDKLGEHFVVKSIEGRQVVIGYVDPNVTKTIVLELDSNEKDAKRPR